MPEPIIPQPSPESPNPQPQAPPIQFGGTVSSPYAAGGPPRIITNGEGSGRLKYVIIAVITVAIVAGLVYAFVLPQLGHPGSTTTATSTVGTTTIIPVGAVSSCGIISSSGLYYLTANLKFSGMNGACISVNSSNVAIVCNGKAITGSGPYVDLAPFSYAILMNGQQNVSITGCLISNFSYGVYARAVSGLKLENDNITMNYVSSVYLNNSIGGTVSNNYIASSSSPYGAVVITNDSVGNNFSNNTLRENGILGFNISSIGNGFTNNYVIGSAFSFACQAGFGLKNSSSASGNLCYNQTGCAFLSCRGTNVPVNFSKVTLTPQITQCGVIRNPGRYSLAGNIDVSQYVNTTGGQPSNCISVESNNVVLSCNGFNVTKAYTAIYVGSASNVTITGCGVIDSINGILLNRAPSASLSNIYLYDNNVSLAVYNTTGSHLTGINENYSYYGIVLQSANATVVKNFTANDNIFGIYLNNTYGSTFVSGTALNNSKFDVFATPGSLNRSTNFMSSTSCYLSDAAWSTCTLITSGTALEFPVSSCSVIKRSGTYNLTQNIVNANSNCINIQADDVYLNCSGRSIVSTASYTPGPAILLNDLYNVTVSGCRITNFNSAVQISNSGLITVSNVIGTTLSTYGITLNNDTGTTLYHDSLSGPSNATISLDKVSGSSILDNNVSQGTSPNVAILVRNSTRNIISGNRGTMNYIGLYIRGASNNNTVSNNTFSISSLADFICDPQDSAMDAEYGGVNYGLNKIGCYWMAAIPTDAAPLPCSATLAPTRYILQSDNVYYAGARCFTIIGSNASQSTIDCNGHTILAANGGTFAYITNSGSITLQNCYLKGFATPIVGINASITIFNNTIFVNSTNLPPGSSAINLTRSSQITIQQTQIFTPYTGIYLNRVNYTNINSDNVTAYGTAYAVYRSLVLRFFNATSSAASGVGLIFSNTTISSFEQNHFGGVSAGLVCSGTSSGIHNNTDAGGNYCSSTSGCLWLSSC